MRGLSIPPAAAIAPIRFDLPRPQPDVQPGRAGARWQPPRHLRHAKASCRPADQPFRAGPAPHAARDARRNRRCVGREPAGWRPLRLAVSSRSESARGRRRRPTRLRPGLDRQARRLSTSKKKPASRSRNSSTPYARSDRPEARQPRAATRRSEGLRHQLIFSARSIIALIARGVGPPVRSRRRSSSPRAWSSAGSTVIIGRLAAPATRVIIVTTFGQPGYLRRAMEAGAVGFMVKDAPAEKLIEGARRPRRSPPALCLQDQQRSARLVGDQGRGGKDQEDQPAQVGPEKVLPAPAQRPRIGHAGPFVGARRRPRILVCIKRRRVEEPGERRRRHPIPPGPRRGHRVLFAVARR